MHVDHHPLLKDFPEYHEQLHALRMSDHHFAKLANEYEEIDKHICRVEDEIENVTPDELHILKQQRLVLKDELHRLLKKAANPSSCCGSCCG